MNNGQIWVDSNTERLMMYQNGEVIDTGVIAYWWMVSDGKLIVRDKDINKDK